MGITDAYRYMQAIPPNHDSASTSLLTRMPRAAASRRVSHENRIGLLAGLDSARHIPNNLSASRRDQLETHLSALRAWNHSRRQSRSALHGKCAEPRHFAAVRQGSTG